MTPFAVINDHEGAVTVVLDEALLSRTQLNLHPLENTATTGITPADLIRFLEAMEHPPLVVRLSGATCHDLHDSEQPPPVSTE